jgi:hypothetical protein
MDNSVLVSDLDFLLRGFSASVDEDLWPVPFELLSADELAVSVNYIYDSSKLCS